MSKDTGKETDSNLSAKADKSAGVKHALTRRNFLKTAAAGSAAVVAAPTLAKLAPSTVTGESANTGPIDYYGGPETAITIAPTTYPGTTVQVETGAEAFYELLRGLGMPYIVAAPGDEWANLWDTIAKNIYRGTESPIYMQVLDEKHSVNMAAGYAMYTGKPLFVPFHNAIGVLNAGLAIKSANYARIPMILGTATSTTFEGQVDSAESVSKFSFTENHLNNVIPGPYYVRWDYETHTNLNLPQIVNRAYQMSMTEPKGCVSLFIPTELMGETVSSVLVPAATRFSPPSLPDINPENLTATAELLAGAQNPIIITSGIGKNPNVVALLKQFANNYGLPVFGGTTWVDYPTTDPMFVTGATTYLPQADVILWLQDSVAAQPFAPPISAPEASKIIYMGMDPVQDRWPYPGMDRYDPNFVFRVDPMNGLTALMTAMASQTTISSSAIAERISNWTSIHNQQTASSMSSITAASSQSPINSGWLYYQLGQVIGNNTILVTETISDSPSSVAIPRPIAATKFDAHTLLLGALGSGLGTAQGILLAARQQNPNQQIAVTIGDGCFNFNPVLSALWTSWQYNLPMLIVIADNGGYEAMANEIVTFQPNGWAVKTGVFPGGKGDPYNYAKLADVFDMYGDTITNPATVNSQLTSAFAAVQQGTTAIIDAKIRLTDNVVLPAKPLVQTVTSPE